MFFTIHYAWWRAGRKGAVESYRPRESWTSPLFGRRRCLYDSTGLLAKQIETITVGKVLFTNFQWNLKPVNQVLDSLKSNLQRQNNTWHMRESLSYYYGILSFIKHYIRDGMAEMIKAHTLIPDYIWSNFFSTQNLLLLCFSHCKVGNLIESWFSWKLN